MNFQSNFIEKSIKINQKINPFFKASLFTYTVSQKLAKNQSINPQIITNQPTNQL